MNSTSINPNSPRGVLVSFAVGIIVGVSVPIIRASTDTNTLHIIGYALTFSGLLGIGVNKYRRYKHGYFYTVIAAAVTGIGVAILASAFIDLLY